MRFPFGHGLSYARFTIGEPQPSATTFTVGGELSVDVPVENTGDSDGTEVVQCYVEPPSVRVMRPRKELKAFGKVHLAPGETATVRLTLVDRSFAVWDRGSGQRTQLKARLPFADMTAPPNQREPGWRIHPGTYVAHIGRSSAGVTHSVPIEVSEDLDTEQANGVG